MRLTCLVLALFIAAAGCTPAGPDFATVELAGQVTANGDPVKEGRITFTPREPSRGPGTGADIVDGRYSTVGVPVGKLLVQFTASRLTGKTVIVMESEMAERINLVPEGIRGGIEIEVQAEDSQRDFELTKETAASTPPRSQP